MINYKLSKSVVFYISVYLRHIERYVNIESILKDHLLLSLRMRYN